jgi:hypothetical protein
MFNKKKQQLKKLEAEHFKEIKLRIELEHQIQRLQKKIKSLEAASDLVYFIDRNKLEENKQTVLLFNTTEKVITLLSGSAITGAEFYSSVKRAWMENYHLLKFQFPFLAIDSSKFFLQYGWSISEETLNKIQSCIIA